jgi:hypothetical protein
LLFYSVYGEITIYDGLDEIAFIAEKLKLSLEIAQHESLALHVQAGTKMEVIRQYLSFILIPPDLTVC